jgi:outer membrane protein TolC
VLFAVAQAFYAAGIADEVLAARQSSIEVASATAHIAQTRYSAGAVTKADVDRAELALVRIQLRTVGAALGGSIQLRTAVAAAPEGLLRAEPRVPPPIGRLAAPSSPRRRER